MTTYTIKNLKTCRGMEDEAFSCTLLRDGKPVCDVQYGGTGGPYRFRWLDAANCVLVEFQRRNWKDEMVPVTGTPEEAAFAAHVMEQPKDIEFDLYANDDMVVGALVERFEAEKKAARLLKTHLVYREVPGGAVYTIPLKGRKAEAGFMQIKSRHPQAMWLNTVPDLGTALLGR